MVAVHTSFTILAALLVVFFMDDLPPRPKEEDGEGKALTPWQEARQSVLVTFKQCRRHRQLLMMPLNIYIGMMQSYSLADLTEVITESPLSSLVMYIMYFNA